MGLRTLLIRLRGRSLDGDPQLLALQAEEDGLQGELADLESRLASAVAEVSALERAARALRPGLSREAALQALDASGALLEAAGGEAPAALRARLEDLQALAARARPPG